MIFLILEMESNNNLNMNIIDPNYNEIISIN